MKRKHQQSSPIVMCVPTSGENYAEINERLKELNSEAFDHIVFAFTIHYIEDIKQCLAFYSDLLIQNGNIIILYIDSSDEDLLLKINASDEKYKFVVNGEQISVRLPFSGEETYTEKRIRPATLREIARELRLDIIFDNQFARCADIPATYTEADTLYSSIHRAMILKKIE